MSTFSGHGHLMIDSPAAGAARRLEGCAAAHRVGICDEIGVRKNIETTNTNYLYFRKYIMARL
jgi:hypothetical protein